MGGKGEEEKEERKGKGRERGKGEEGEGKQAYTTLQPLLRPSITRKPNDVTVISILTSSSSFSLNCILYTHL